MKKTGFVDIAGHRFGRWTVIDRAPNRGSKIAMWNVKCDCGTVSVVPGGHLRSGASTSCGCARRETCAANKTIHGASSDPEYNVWKSMKARCHGKHVDKNYGGRGIVVCDAWRNSYASFKADMGPRPSPEHSIDRIDNNGPYAPGNCRWVTRDVQNRNKRDNRLLTFNGETRLAYDWGEIVGLPGVEVRKRVHNGMAPELALTKPLKQRRKLNEKLVLEMRAEYASGGVTMQQIADRTGMDSGSICNAINGKSWAHVGAVAKVKR